MRETISKSRKIKCKIINSLIYASAFIIVILLLSLIGCVLYNGLSYISLEFLFSKPSLLQEKIGILPNILNTLYIIIITLIIVLPLGVGAAIYLNEYAKSRKAAYIIELCTETLAGIPSIIYGLVGMLVFVQFCSLGTSIIAGALTLVIMTMPTIIRTTQESLKSVENSLREGSLAMGAGKWYMIRTIVLPSSIDGIVNGCILSIGRIVCESAALIFTAGMANEILGLFEAFSAGNSGSTLAVSLYVYAKERGDSDTAFAIAVILLILTLIINLSAKYFARRFKKEK